MKKSLFVVAVTLASILIVMGRAQQSPESKSAVDQHIATFDDLDFNVFTHQKWDEFKKSRSKDVVVHWPDGHRTKGIEKHIEDMKAMFVYAPDTRILVRPVKFGSGPWTSVIGGNGGYVHRANAGAEYEAHCADRQGVQADHEHGRPLERTGHDGRRMPVLGQSDLHAANRS